MTSQGGHEHEMHNDDAPRPEGGHHECPWPGSAR